MGMWAHKCATLARRVRSVDRLSLRIPFPRKSNQKMLCGVAALPDELHGQLKCQ